MRRVILISVVLLSGCRKATNAPVAAAPNPPADAAIEHLDKVANLLQKRVALQGELNDFSLDVMKFGKDCWNVGPDDWDARKCTKRRKSLLKKSAALQAKSDAAGKP